MERKRIVVKLKNSGLVYPPVTLNEYYIDDKPDQINFSIPTEYWPDVQKVLKGRYSKLSPAAKDMIRLNSGLNYRRERVIEGETQFDTDARLKALDLSDADDYRGQLEEMLGIKLSKDDELISPPGKNEIWIE